MKRVQVNPIVIIMIIIIVVITMQHHHPVRATASNSSLN